MGKKRLYIAYGSNLNLKQMAARCPTAKPLGSAKLKGYELLFRGGTRGAVATVEPKAGASVPVLVWEIKPWDEAALDVYEGFPRFYGKNDLKIALNGRAVGAMAYVMTPGMPSNSYLSTIAEGYRTAGFDLSVLAAAVERSAEVMELEETAKFKQSQELDDSCQGCDNGRQGFDGGYPDSPVMKWW